MKDVITENYSLLFGDCLERINIVVNQPYQLGINP